MSKVLTPFNDRVIIKPIEEDEQMYGNIVIPDLGKERPEMGEVIAVGPGRQTEFGQFIRVNALQFFNLKFYPLQIVTNFLLLLYRRKQNWNLTHSYS